MRSVENLTSRQKSSHNLKIDWRDDFLPTHNVQSKCAILISAMISFNISRPRDLKIKIGDQTVMHRVTREENQPAGIPCVFHSACHRQDQFSSQGARVERGNAEELARSKDR